MKSILLKGMNYSFKSNLSIHKTIIDKLPYNNNNNNYNINLNKVHIKPKLLLPKKNNVMHDILLPLSLQYKKCLINSSDKASPYCYTEANINSENNTNKENNEKNFKKLDILPKIKENNTNKCHSKKNIYLGSNKYSLNLNSGSALSCGKIFADKNSNNNNKSKEVKENNYVNVKKIFLKEIIFNKNKSEKRQRTFGFRTRMKNNYNALIKREKRMDMNNMIISNDFHGNKIIDLDESLKKGINKFNIFIKYQQIKAINKRKINNNNLDTSKTFNKVKPNENEKNESIDNTMSNNNKCILSNDTEKRKHFKSFELINKINTSKIAKTLSNDSKNNINIINNANINIKENKKNNLQTINGQKYFQKKIKNKNEDIKKILENTNN